ncbi:hypothetical protein [Thalassotalea ganghwensis]
MAGVKFNLKERLPDILLESLFIVVALLLALGLDQWRDDQKAQQVAENARKAIYTELKDNQKKLNDKLSVHQEILAHLTHYIEEKEQALAKNDLDDVEISFEYQMVLISSAAWDSAKVTQVVQNFAFSEITNFSQIYQMQRLFLSNQTQIIEKVMAMGELQPEQLLGFAKGLAHRLTILIELNQNFAKGISSVLAEQNSQTK